MWTHSLDLAWKKERWAIMAYCTHKLSNIVTATTKLAKHCLLHGHLANLDFMRDITIFPSSVAVPASDSTASLDLNYWHHRDSLWQIFHPSSTHNNIFTCFGAFITLLHCFSVPINPLLHSFTSSPWGGYITLFCWSTLSPHSRVLSNSESSRLQSPSPHLQCTRSQECSITPNTTTVVCLKLQHGFPSTALQS